MQSNSVLSMQTTTSSLYGPDETPLPTLFLSGNVANTDPFESTTDLVRASVHL